MPQTDDQRSELMNELRSQRDAMAAELQERTKQLQEVVRDLHAANKELRRLRREQAEPSGGSVDWDMILNEPPVD